MVHAFIMVKTAAGKSEGLLAEIADLESVADAHIVAGNYDIIAEATRRSLRRVADRFLEHSGSRRRH